MNRLPEFVNDRLDRLSWSKAELARRSGISRSLVTDVLNQRSPATADFCIAIAHALSMSPTEMLRIAGILPELPPAVEDENKIVHIIRSLDDRTRKTVLSMLQGLATTNH